MSEQVYEWFKTGLAKQGISLTERQQQQLEMYYNSLVSWNEKMNLTGITAHEAVYEKHFYDSLSLSFSTHTDVVRLQEIQTLADIGSGAGFPSLPLKIVFPHLCVTIVDSLNKRIQFLKHVCDTIGLQRVDCVHGRAEDVARDSVYRDRYDLVTARAVARMAVLNEFCLPFVRTGGCFAAMKGTDPTEELQEAAFSLKQLKGRVVCVDNMRLPLENSDRHIIWVKKVADTPKAYPRKAGVPLRQPLV